MVIRCKICGGDLLLKEGSNLAACAYCGSMMTVSLHEDEKPQMQFQATQQEPQRVIQQVVYQGETSALLQRGYMALEQEDWLGAMNFFEAVLNQKADSAEAYFGKYLAAMRYTGIEDMQAKRLGELGRLRGMLKQACVPQTERIEGLVHAYADGRDLTETDVRTVCRYDLSYNSKTVVFEERYQRENALFEENVFLSNAMQFADDSFKRKLTDLWEHLLKGTEEALEKAKQEELQDVERIKKEYEAFLVEAEQKLILKKSQAEADRVQEDTEVHQKKGTMDSEESMVSEDSALERNYLTACHKKVNAKTAEDWLEAAELFAACGIYKNSYEYMEQCRKQAEKQEEKKSTWKFV